MYQIVYYSRLNKDAFSGSTLSFLRDIVEVSQRNNARDDISGALIFDNEWFLQILEGPQEAIERTYNRIQKDPRHTTVTLVEKRPLAARLFPEWGMGGTLRSLDVQEIFLDHGIGGPIEPSRLSASTIVNLALDLKRYEIARKSARGAAA